jgi:predicted nucleic acid-binding protein
LKLIDANVLVYARGVPHPYRDACRSLLAEVEAGRLEANVDTEVLQEVMYVYWYRKRLERGLDYLGRLLILFPTPLPVSGETIAAARDILAAYRQLEPRDAIHAAVVLNHGLEAIISADRAFDAITEIKRLDPLELYG